MRNGENAEAWQADFFTSLQCAGDSSEHSVNSRTGISLRQTALFRDCGNQFVLVHWHFLSLPTGTDNVTGLGGVYSKRSPNQACQCQKSPVFWG
jgi:hypothetical protein